MPAPDEYRPRPDDHHVEPFFAGLGVPPEETTRAEDEPPPDAAPPRRRGCLPFPLVLLVRRRRGARRAPR